MEICLEDGSPNIQINVYNIESIRGCLTNEGLPAKLVDLCVIRMGSGIEYKVRGGYKLFEMFPDIKKY
jgi:hypothetical protein